MPKTRRPAAWARYLNNPEEEYTLEEYRTAVMARMLAHIETMQASLEHIEGMVGALDMAEAVKAEQDGRFYPASQKLRAALDTHRDVSRLQAYEERKKALGESV